MTVYRMDHAGYVVEDLDAAVAFFLALAHIPGIARLTFAIDSVDGVFESIRPHGAELVGEIAQYEDLDRYCYVRGPAGVIIGLVEELR